jgi:hypothetical protein
MPRVGLPHFLFRGPRVVDTTDRDGVRVVCAESWWLQKISPKHQEMRRQYAAATATINQPDLIHQSSTHANRKVLYKRGILPVPHHDLYVRVVVEYHEIVIKGFPPATLVTAFSCTNIKEGETQLWP